MKKPAPEKHPREQLKFAVVLIVLAVLAVLAWWSDPRRTRGGDSRIPWPPAPTSNP